MSSRNLTLDSPLTFFKYIKIGSNSGPSALSACSRMSFEILDVLRVVSSRGEVWERALKQFPTARSVYSAYAAHLAKADQLEDARAVSPSLAVAEKLR